MSELRKDEEGPGNRAFHACAKALWQEEAGWVDSTDKKLVSLEKMQDDSGE